MRSARRSWPALLIAVLALTGALVALAATAAAQNGGSVLIAGTAGEVDLHVEAQIVGGDVQIVSDRAPDDGQALDRCDPDPRPAPNERPDCDWATPAGAGQEQVNTSGALVDNDTSPNASYTPTADAITREVTNGIAGFENDGTIEFRGAFFDDQDMRVRLAPRTLDAYLAPEGDANNRWRRICGTGVVEQTNQGQGAGTPPRAPFLAGQVRKFVLQTWDADWRDPSDNDGGNQDYWIMDVLAPGSTFDTSRCELVAGAPPREPDRPGQPGAAPQGTAPGTAPGTGPGATGEGPSASVPLRGTARLSGPGGCVSRTFRATVVGQNIAQVTFSLDGRRIRTLLRPDSRGRWTVRIAPRRLRVGTHRVVAGVSFRVGATPRVRRVRLAFQRCRAAQQRVAPRFTG